MLIGRTENQVKNRWKSITKKAEKTCPKGFDPIKILISEMKAEPDMTTLNSMMPVSPILSPGFLYPFGDLGFSSMADQIKSVYQLGMASINNPDPSPSTLLFLSSPHMRH